MHNTHTRILVSHMAFVGRRTTNASVAFPARVQQQTFQLAAYQAMTNQYAKDERQEYLDLYNNTKDGGYRHVYPWNANRWDQNRWGEEPRNILGYRFADDTRGVQHFAPAGMENQLHASRSDGTEMKTTPVRRHYAVW